MILRKASLEDLSLINNFYTNVCEKTKGMKENARWTYGIYPNEDLVKSFIEKDCFYLFFEDELVGVTALVDGQEPLFDGMNWYSKLNNKEITEVRILAVSPLKQGTGYSRFFIETIEEYLKSIGKKAIRLCVIDTNKIAEKFYQKCGFNFVGEKLDTTPNVPWKTLNFYEKNL